MHVMASFHGWRSMFLPLSWPVTSSLFDLKYWGQTLLVMWSVSSFARYWSFFQTASGILLCSFCSQFVEASVKRCCASLFETAIISILQVRKTPTILVLLQSHCFAWFLGNTSFKIVVITEMNQAIYQVEFIDFIDFIKAGGRNFKWIRTKFTSLHWNK